jgi:alpha/beta hydrolase fold
MPAPTSESSTATHSDLMTELDRTFKRRKVQVGDVYLHYALGGQGDPVVLLHGWPQTWYMWRKVLLPLAQHYTALAPDQRGSGDSDKPEAGYDAKTAVRRAEKAGRIRREPDGSWDPARVSAENAPHEERDQERPVLEVLGVEQRDHQHRAEIADDRPRQQGYLEAARYAVSEQRQHAERERNVGRHWHAPAAHPRSPSVTAR